MGLGRQMTVLTVTLLCDVHSCLLLIYSWAKSGALSPVKSWLQTDFLLPSCFFNQSEGE